MDRLTITIDRAWVWEEAAKVAAYTGDKAIADADAYNRLMLTDGNIADLQRFWDDATAIATDRLKEMVASVDNTDDVYTVALNVSVAYDRTLDENVRTALRGFLVDAIIGQWFKLAYKEEADVYTVSASSKLESVLRMLYSRAAPPRPLRG